MESSKATFEAGDVCLDCRDLGLDKYLRYFKINLNGDTILKCESSECMYPYNNDMNSSDEEEKHGSKVTETNTLQLINDLIFQYDNGHEFKDSDGGSEINDNANEKVAHFDITFLNDLNEMKYENLCKSEIVTKTDEFKEIVQSECSSLQTLKSKHCEISGNQMEVSIDPNAQKQADINLIQKCPTLSEIEDNNKLSNLSRTLKSGKSKIDIQSIETINFETSLSIKDVNFPNTIKLPEFKVINSAESTSLQVSPAKTRFKSKCKTRTAPNAKKFNATTSISFDIPKADIIKGNSLLKKLALMDFKEPAPRFSTKRNRSKQVANNGNIKSQITPFPSCDTNSDSMYSVEKLSEMFLNKNKNI